MLVASLNALRQIMHSNFPDVKRLYVTKMPNNFTRPSFFFDLVNVLDSTLSKSAYNTTITWQIIYFAPLDANNEPDVFDQLSAVGTMENIAMQLSLSAPSGEIFNVLGVEVTKQDDEISCIVRLDIDRTRWTQPNYDLMLDIRHIQQIGVELLHQN